jgi:hypothetical protein
MTDDLDNENKANDNDNAEDKDDESGDNSVVYRTATLHIKNSVGKISIHPKSVNCRETQFESRWMVYYHMLKTTQVAE